MIAAINMQWLVIGVAALVVVVLLVIVLVRRRSEDERPAAAPTGRPARPPAGQATRPAAGPPPGWTGLAAATPSEPPGPNTAPGIVATAASPAGSFLDEPLARDFEALGKPLVPEAPPAPRGPFPVDPFGSHEDIFPPEEPPAEAPPAAETTAAEAAPAAEPDIPDAPAEVASDVEVETAPAAEPDIPDAPAEVAPAAAAADTPALLSDIIVTSGRDEVDLADPDVRALLVSLVDDEIALAKVCRGQGQTLDAILQLTEAEKACTALGLDDTLAEVKALLAELQN